MTTFRNRSTSATPTWIEGAAILLTLVALGCGPAAGDAPEGSAATSRGEATTTTAQRATSCLDDSDDPVCASWARLFEPPPPRVAPRPLQDS